MSAEETPDGNAQDDTVALAAILTAVSRESGRLAAQCGAIQGAISAILDTVNHPDLGAEIHMLQDIDRIQQTLEDIAAILAVTGTRASAAQIGLDEIGSAIRLESLRHRLGRCEHLSGDACAPEPPDITWL